MKLKNTLFQTLKGMAIGVAIIIPGVSGGTIAVLLNVYEDIINAISNLNKNFKNSVKTLLPIALGIIVAFAGMYFPIKWALTNFPLQTISLFAGLMIATCPKMILDTMHYGFSKRDLISLIIPFFLGTCVCFMPNMDTVYLLADMPVYNYCLLFLVGTLSSCALVVPGISGSMLLLILGYYTPLLNTIANLKTNFMHSGLVLLIFGVGLILGFISIAKLMKLLLKKQPRATHYAILSFVLGSIPAIFISFDYSAVYISSVTILTSVLCGLIGSLASFFIIKMVDKKSGEI